MRFEKSPVGEISSGKGPCPLQQRAGRAQAVDQVCGTAPVPPVGAGREAQLLFERYHYPPGALCPLRHWERLVPPQGWGNGKGKLLLSSNFSNHVIFHSGAV